MNFKIWLRVIFGADEAFMYKELKLDRDLSYQDAKTKKELSREVKRQWFKIIEYQPDVRKYVAITVDVINERRYKVYLNPSEVKVKLGKPYKNPDEIFKSFLYKELKLDRELSYKDIETNEELSKEVKREWFKIIDYQPSSKKYVAQTLYVVNGRYYKVALKSDTVKVKLGKPEK